MNLSQILNIIGDGLLCLLYIGGIVAGIIGLTRKKALPGILAAVGFLLLGLNLVLNYVISLVLVPVAIRSGGDFSSTYGWLNCLRTPLYLLGAAALVVLVFTLLVGKKSGPQPAPETQEIPEIPPMP
ncbi:MAG: hypothetical protein FD146_1971 [Anaerolineaceae bacterium]|nr:MAG: hypothetical protein FD146_1971 [Anaerolineaceae bacterium]